MLHIFKIFYKEKSEKYPTHLGLAGFTLCKCVNFTQSKSNTFDSICLKAVENLFWVQVKDKFYFLKLCSCLPFSNSTMWNCPYNSCQKLPLVYLQPDPHVEWSSQSPDLKASENPKADIKTHVHRFSPGVSRCENLLEKNSKQLAAVIEKGFVLFKKALTQGSFRFKNVLLCISLKYLQHT